VDGGTARSGQRDAAHPAPTPWDERGNVMRRPIVERFRASLLWVAAAIGALVVILWWFLPTVFRLGVVGVLAGVGAVALAALITLGLVLLMRRD